MERSDPSKLEGRPKNEKGPREFFWDSVALYVISVIMGLAVIDVVTEFIRNSSVSCYVPSGAAVNVRQADYINNFCSASLPTTEYFPAFIVVHGILIAIPHYLWLNHYGGSFDFFFAQASQMDRTHDEKTGKYSDKNLLIVQQLNLAFTTYKQNWMYFSYVLKLTGQLSISIAGFFVTVFYFTDFNDAFYCPRNFNSSNNAAADSEFWPFDVQVRCVFNSLRLYSTIRVADMILVALLVLCYTWAFIWCIQPHSTELGAERVAKFSFQTGMSPEYYVQKGIFSPSCWKQSPACCKSCRKCICNILNFVLCPFGPGPRIWTNLDFFILKLFRTDSGLGYVFRNMQILHHLKELDDNEQTLIQLSSAQQDNPGTVLIGPEEITADLHWAFRDDRGNPFDSNELLEIPSSMRGAVVGFSAYSPSNKLAIYITFGSSSKGIASALSRVFARVAVVNFTPTTEVVTTKAFSSYMVDVLCREDILSSEVHDSNQLLPGMKEIWDPAQSGQIVLKTDFIVVGPIHKKSNQNTVIVFLDKLSTTDKLNGECKLLTMKPTMIGGNSRCDEFLEWEPPKKRFEEFTPNVRMKKMKKDESMDWPPIEATNGEQTSCCITCCHKEKDSNSNEFEHVLCGDFICNFRFKMYKHLSSTN